MRVLIIEDENIIREQVAEDLKKSGFTVDLAADGSQGLYVALEYPIDVAVIDLGLPNSKGGAVNNDLGLDIIRAIRAKGLDYPIIILTARDRWQSKVEGLEAGADDYVTKPFHTEELIARLRVQLRRTGRWTQAELHCGPIRLNTSEQRVYVNETEVILTAYEYRVLEHLILHAGEVISKTRLTDSLYEEDTDRDSNVIEVFIRRLRIKLDPDDTLKPIETLRGRGYRFTLART
ncbi:MAG: hypothetical protein RL122_1441 [Pseudomonadota bacterium]|jgi:two-component system response regulator PhoP|uniref:Response regulator transcription factor n=1 Tax=Thiothrix fructosivorans TaxID=111770 RepID=A0A8B0SDX7_9GAMM|nr:response regulator transcription factor [Thiothrix fructosivorans]MBO0614715.1 response regulator transcription factor [Thiothrix fructosivorans]QTX09536.1 response regulator transcription factor [Thiothrix fructosivorans]